jgi:uncharacterized heparinase superfamily protein
VFDAKGYRIRRWVSSALWRTPFYRLSLWSWPQKRLSLSLDPAGLPDPYHFGGAGVASVEALPWQAAVVSLERQAELHSFVWVAGLAATEGAAAAAPARAILRAWLDQYRQWDPVAWRADVVGERLCIWIAHAALLAPSEDPSLQKDFLAALSRHARHLRRTAHWEVDGVGRLKALRGLLAALLALRAGDRRVDAAFRVIEREANAQILRDGGHIGRSPALQLEALRQLIGMRDILDAANVEVPEAIMAAINRAAPILRFFRHGDGRLALFNDSIEGDSTALDLTLSRSGVKARAPASAPHIGFERLQSGKSLLIMDCGAPPPERFGGHPHAGTLSFELSHGRERLIVNCGAYRGASAQWQSAMRTTAAHSTLVLADAPSAEIDDRGHLTAGPRTVTRERTEEEGNQWTAASHDGYLARFGLTHERQLFLAADGEDLRGEDRLVGDAGQDFVIRFHLHPNVQASMTQDGSAALLRLPSGAGWRLRAEGAVLSLAESVYLGTGELRKSQQIVLGGHVGSQGATVRWAIRREGRRRADVLATSAPNAREQPRERS